MLLHVSNVIKVHCFLNINKYRDMKAVTVTAAPEKKYSNCYCLYCSSGTIFVSDWPVMCQKSSPSLRSEAARAL